MNKTYSISVRPAEEGDLQAMCDLLNEIIAIGGTTAQRSAFDVDRMRGHYFAPPTGISCFVAVEGETVLGFQALEWSDPSWRDEYQLPDNWASIATFVAPQAQGKGVGKLLFDMTRKSAEDAGVHAIDATIRSENLGGQVYYGGLGFEAYQERGESISRKLVLSQ